MLAVTMRTPTSLRFVSAVFLLCFYLCFCAVPAHAQTSVNDDGVTKSAMNGPSHRVFDRDALTAALNRTMTLAPASGTWMQAARGSRHVDSPLNGTLIGAAIGAAFGATVVAIIARGGESGEPGARAITIPLLSAGIGGLVGFAVDKLHPSQ